MELNRVVNQDSTALERSIVGESVANRATVQSQWKDTKIPGFFESYGLSFKLSFPQVNLLQQLKATRNAMASSFSKAGNAISSFSLKKSIGNIYLKFETNVKGSAGPESVKQVQMGLIFDPNDTGSVTPFDPRRLF